MIMSSHRFLWPSIALVSALGAFLSVRAIWPMAPVLAIQGANTTTLSDNPSASGEIDAALGDAAKGENVLARRLRLLELLAKAVPVLTARQTPVKTIAFRDIDSFMID